MAPNRSLLDRVVGIAQLIVILKNAKLRNFYKDLVIPLNVITFYPNRMPFINGLGYDEQNKKA